MSLPRCFTTPAQWKKQKTLRKKLWIFLLALAFFGFGYPASAQSPQAKLKGPINNLLAPLLRSHSVQKTKAERLKIQNPQSPGIPTVLNIRRPSAKPHNYDPHTVLVEFATSPSAEMFGKSLSSEDLKSETERITQHIQSLFMGEAVVSKVYKNLSQVKGTLFALIKSDTLTAQEMMKRLKGDPMVKAVSYNFKRHLLNTPNDPYFPEQWGLNNTGQENGTPDADVDAPEAWDISTGDNSVVVAVVDTGVDYTHEDLAANMWNNAPECGGTAGVDDDGNGYVDDCLGYDFAADNDGNNNNNPMDIWGHGTHVAGIIGAVGNNSLGVTGVNWHTKIMAVKVVRPNGDLYDSDIIEGLNYVLANKINGVNVVAVNASWGGYGDDPLMKDAIDQLGDHGIVFVAAAGNQNVSTDVFLFTPSCFNSPNIISVGATDNNDQKASFSNFGLSTVDLGAPGVGIFSTIPGVGYVPQSGDLFFDDLESGNGNWDTGGTNNSWAITNEENHTPGGQYSWSDSPNGNYLNNTDSWVAINHDIDLSGVDPSQCVYLGFWIKGETEYGWDFLYVEFSSDGGNNWEDIGYFSGSTYSGWTLVNVPIAPNFLTTSFRFRFRLVSDGSVIYDGYYIDDVGIGIVNCTKTQAFSDDMESGSGNWDTGGTNNSWAITNEENHTPGGQYSWSDSPNGNYLNNTNSWVAVNHDIDLSGYNEAYLMFWFKGETEADIDYLNVDFSSDGGAHWSEAYYITGAFNQWTPAYVYIPHQYLTNSFRFRFRLVSNSSYTYDGYYIDDVALYGINGPNGGSNAYQAYSGTSMATPFVTGAVALMASEYPGETVCQRISRILTGVDVLSQLQDYWWSSGRLNLYNSLSAVTLNPYITSLTPTQGLTPGTQFTITGCEFGDNPGQVIFTTGTTDTPAPIVNWSNNTITARVPSGTGKYVRVVTNAGASNYSQAVSAWRQVSGMPEPRLASVAAPYNGKIYLFGGLDSFFSLTVQNSCFVYDPQSDSWSNCANMPTRRVVAAAAEAGGKIYVIGGLDANIDYTNVVEAYDPATDTWDTNVSPLPQALAYIKAVTLNGKIYVMGGMDDTDSPVNTLYRYDPATDTWTQLADMNQARYDHEAVALNGKIYVFGGVDANGQYLSSAEVYDPDTDTWTYIPDMPIPLAIMGAASDGNKAYLAGGASNYLIGPWYMEYNPASDSYYYQENEIRETIVPKIWFPMVYVPEEHALFNMGGMDPSWATLDEVERLDIPQQHTLTIDPVPEHGTVKVPQDGSQINCGSGGNDCTETYDSGSSVTLHGVPDPGYQFSGWTGDCSACGTHAQCTITMDSDKTCSANFSLVYYTLTVEKGGQGSGEITSDDGNIDTSREKNSYDYPAGSGVVLTARANVGSTFSHWEGDCSFCGANPTCRLTMTRDKTCRAIFDLVKHTLSVFKEGAGNGSISSNDGNIDTSQGKDSHEYVYGTVVTLTANTGPGSTFEGWGGDCSACGTHATCQVTMTQDRSCSGSFALLNYLLQVEVEPQEGGSVTGPGIDCPQDCSQEIPYGTTVTLVAQPQEGYLLDHWEGCDDTRGIFCDLTIQGDRTVKAHFRRILYPLAVSLLGRGEGDVVSTDGNIDTGQDKMSHQYPYGSSVVLEAHPGAHSTFAGWGGDCASCGTEPSCTLTVDSGKDCTATFDLERTTLTVTKEGNGEGEVVSIDGGINTSLSNNQATYTYGTVVDMDAYPGDDSLFGGWGGDCASCDHNLHCTVTMTESRNCTVTFIRKKKMLQVTLTPPGSGRVTGGGIDCPDTCSAWEDPGSSVTLQAQAYPGFAFGSWEGCDRVDGTTCYLTMSDNKEVTATFTEILHTLFVEVNDPQKGWVESSDGSIDTRFGRTNHQYREGTHVDLMAHTKEGYEFSGWSGDCSTCGTDITCSLTVDRDIHCTAEFTQIPNEPPVIDSFTANPTSGEAPLDVTFTCQAHDPDGSIAQYQIAFGDGSTDTNTTGSFTHSYNNPGSYQAVCTVQDDQGATVSSHPVTITVSEHANEPPVIDSFTANPTSGEAPLDVTFTCQAHDPDGSIAQYQIAFGDGSSDTNTTGSFTHTYSNPGSYQAVCTVQDDQGATVSSHPVTITVSPSYPLTIEHQANSTSFSGGEDYETNHLELVFFRPQELTEPVDLYISLTQPAAEGGTVTYYFQHSDSRITLPNGIYFNSASPTTEKMPYLTSSTMPDTLQLYGPYDTTPIFNDGWVIPAPTLCDGLPDGNYTFTVEAYEPGTDNLLARGEVTITLNRGCE